MRLGLLRLGERQRDNAIAHLGFDLVLINLARNAKTAPEWTDIVFEKFWTPSTFQCEGSRRG